MLTEGFGWPQAAGPPVNGAGRRWGKVLLLGAAAALLLGDLRSPGFLLIER